jgi:hypothetical protein
MLANTGAVSLVLFGIFILIAVVGLFFAIKAVIKDEIPTDKLEKIVDLAKYTIVSVAIATITLIITDLFKEREQDVKELEYFDKYVNDVKNVDGLQQRFLLARYLSIVAPSGELKRSWQKYYETLLPEYEEYLQLKKESEELARKDSLTKQEVNRKEQVDQKIEEKEAPLVSSFSTLKPRVYIQIGAENQRSLASSLQATLLNEQFLVPGIENVARKGNVYIPTRAEVRYYREDELQGALRLVEILKSQNTGLPINEVPQKIPGTGRGTRPNHYEIWFSRSK